MKLMEKIKGDIKKPCLLPLFVITTNCGKELVNTFVLNDINFIYIDCDDGDKLYELYNIDYYEEFDIIVVDEYIWKKIMYSRYYGAFFISCERSYKWFFKKRYFCKFSDYYEVNEKYPLEIESVINNTVFL